MSPALAGWCRLHDSHRIQMDFHEIVITVPRLIAGMHQTWTGFELKDGGYECRLLGASK